ncbi:MAG: zinc transporter ZupT [Bacillota bacterium]
MEIYLLPLGMTLLAGLSTGLGGLATYLVKDFRQSHMSILMGFAAGVMIYISFAELLAEAVDYSGFFRANLAFFAGILGMYLLDLLLPHEYLAEKSGFACHQEPESCREDAKMLSAGLLTALGIFLHNFPEGVIVFLSALHDPRLGVTLMIAIALHNIPEGVSVAMPLYYATGDRRRAITYAFLSGLAEPLGALATLLLFGSVLTSGFINLSLAFVAGIMVFISLHELLPLAHQTESPESATAGVLVGMAAMFITLALL